MNKLNVAALAAGLLLASNAFAASAPTSPTIVIFCPPGSLHCGIIGNGTAANTISSKSLTAKAGAGAFKGVAAVDLANGTRISR